jgi:hypothetical protein
MGLMFLQTDEIMNKNNTTSLLLYDIKFGFKGEWIIGHYITTNKTVYIRSHIINCMDYYIDKTFDRNVFPVNKDETYDNGLWKFRKTKPFDFRELIRPHYGKEMWIIRLLSERDVYELYFGPVTEEEIEKVVEEISWRIVKQ